MGRPWSDVVRCRWCGDLVILDGDVWKDAVEITTLGERDPQFLGAVPHTCRESAADQSEALGFDGAGGGDE